MTTCYLSPIGNNTQTSTSGAPLSGGLIYTYQAGTSTPQATYMDNSGAVGQSNPIVLNTYGLPANPIWLVGGQAYKFVIKDALGNTIRTVDTVAGIDDAVAVTASQQALPSFASSLATVGYQKSPSGLIVQWGSSSGITDSFGILIVTFPISFPTAVFTVCQSNGDGVTTPGGNPTLQSSNTGGAVFKIFTGTTPLSGGSARVNWVAYGK